MKTLDIKAELSRATASAKDKLADLKGRMEIGCIERRGCRIIGEDHNGDWWVAVGVKVETGTQVGFAHTSVVKEGDMLQFGAQEDAHILQKVIAGYANQVNKLVNLRFESKRSVDQRRVTEMERCIAACEESLAVC